jgi:hypothetical protein
VGFSKIKLSIQISLLYNVEINDGKFFKGRFGDIFEYLTTNTTNSYNEEVSLLNFMLQLLRINEGCNFGHKKIIMY